MNNKGFTLVEMLITLTIFSLGFVMIAAIYVGISNAQNRAKVSVEYLNEGEIVFEQLAREIRGKMIDTSSACPTSCGDPNTYVCLSDLANGKTFLRYNATDHSVEINRGTVCSQNAAWIRVSDPAIKVTDMQFLSSAEVNDQQQLTTVLMTVEPTVASKAATPIHLQTAISSRVFLPAKPTL